MKVSIIIPTFRRSDFLIRAIDSVYKQDYRDFDIIVIDDNGFGTDFQQKNSLLLQKYIALPNFRYTVLSKNSGACIARNHGATISESEILMFLDDDDYYLPNKISKQIEILSNPKIDACLCGMKRIDEKDFEIISNENFPRGNDLKSYILDGNCFTTMIAIRKKVFLEIGGFSEISRFQDKFFMYKFYENKKIAFLIQEQLFILSEHQQERISLGNITKISDAYYKLYDFEKKHFQTFSNQEKNIITNRFFFNLARIRVSGNWKQRMEGIHFLLKSKSMIINRKILIKLIFSDKFITHFKK